MADSPYALVRIAGRYGVVTFTSPDGECVPLEIPLTAVAGQEHVRIAGIRHERACREAAAAEVAQRHADAVEAYLVSLPDGMYSDRIDPRFNDEEDLARQRAEMVRHLADALAYADPFQAARWFDRSLGVTLTVGMVHLCEAYLPQVEALLGDGGIRLEAARAMEARIGKDRMSARLLERWREESSAVPDDAQAPSP